MTTLAFLLTQVVNALSQSALLFFLAWTHRRRVLGLGILAAIAFCLIAGVTAPPALPTLLDRDRAEARPTTRQVFFQSHGLIDCPIVQRDDLRAGFTAEGPMVIEEVVSTTLVHPAQRLTVDDVGVIRIDLGEAGGAAPGELPPEPTRRGG